MAWRVALEARGLGPISINVINVRITAVRKLAVEAADKRVARAGARVRIARIKGVRSHGVHVGNWLSLQQAQTLLNTPDVQTKKGLRDRAMFAVLLGSGFEKPMVSDIHEYRAIPRFSCQRCFTPVVRIDLLRMAANRKEAPR